MSECSAIFSFALKLLDLDTVDENLLGGAKIAINKKSTTCTLLLL